MAHCTDCGQANRDTANFCAYCGQPMAQPAAARKKPLDMQCVSRELQRGGWNDTGPGSYMGFNFECMGSRKAIGLVQWNVLVHSLPVLDAETIKSWADRFQQMNKQVQSWVMGKAFILCLVAQEIDPAVLGNIQSNNFGLFGVFRMKGGGGMILIGDEKNRQVYGEIPRLPRDAHNYMSDTMKALMRCLTAAAVEGMA